MKNPKSSKERGLLKGAMRRVFSRSDLRKTAIAKTVIIGYVNKDRPRVKKWSICNNCLQDIPTYQMEVDHVEPLIPLNRSLEDMSWEEVVDRLWCEESNLVAICKDCHKDKTKREAKQRREYKKGKKNEK